MLNVVLSAKCRLRDKEVMEGNERDTDGRYDVDFWGITLRRYRLLQ